MKFLLLLAALSGLILPARDARADTASPLSGPGNLGFVAQKLRTGQEVTVGFLGGSITQGAGASEHSKSYYWQTRTTLQKYATDLGGRVKTELAAVGGTGTAYGVYRAGVQLLDKNPDLLIIEFAVNDLGNPKARDGMEGIVRQALTRNPKMGIVLFHTINARGIQEYYDKNLVPPSVSAFHEVAAHYKLVEINAGPSARELFVSGQSTPKAFFPDTTHPSNAGHAFYAEVLSTALTQALTAAKSENETPVLPAPLGDGALAYARLIKIQPTQKTGDWEELPAGYYTYLGSWKTRTPNATLVLPIKGESISLLCKNVSKLRVTGPGIEKIVATKARPGGIPSLLPIYSGGPIDGELTVEALPNGQGDTEVELCAIAAIQRP